MIERIHKSSTILYISLLFGCSSANNKISDIDNNLIIPPSLKIPNDIKPDPDIIRNQQNEKVAVNVNTTESKKIPETTQSLNNNSLYYVIIGTYPNQLDAIKAFSHISSLDLEQPAMETRQTEAGTLHMVRLGPYSNQEDVEKTKAGLTNSGVSGFKIVRN